MFSRINSIIKTLLSLIIKKKKLINMVNRKSEIDVFDLNKAYFTRNKKIYKKMKLKAQKKSLKEQKRKFFFGEIISIIIKFSAYFYLVLIFFLFFTPFFMCNNLIYCESDSITTTESCNLLEQLKALPGFSISSVNLEVIDAFQILLDKNYLLYLKVIKGHRNPCVEKEILFYIKQISSLEESEQEQFLNEIFPLKKDVLDDFNIYQTEMDRPFLVWDLDTPKMLISIKKWLLVNPLSRTVVFSSPYKEGLTFKDCRMFYLSRLKFLPLHVWLCLMYDYIPILLGDIQSKQPLYLMLYDFPIKLSVEGSCVWDLYQSDYWDSISKDTWKTSLYLRRFTLHNKSVFFDD